MPEQTVSFFMVKFQKVNFYLLKNFFSLKTYKQPGLLEINYYHLLMCCHLFCRTLILFNQNEEQVRQT